MKPPIKLAMLEEFSESLSQWPNYGGHDLVSLLYRVFRMCSARGEGNVVMLNWDDPSHQELAVYLTAALRPELCAWVMSHIRYDGVPPSVKENLL